MKSRETELLVLYLTVDLLILNAAMFLVAWLDMNISARNYQFMSVYTLHGNLSWIIAYLIFTKKNLFLRDNFRNRLLRVTKRQLVFYVVAAVLAIFFIPGTFFKIFFLKYTLLFYFGRIIVYRVFYHIIKIRRRKNISSLNAAIIGNNETGDVLSMIIKSNPTLGYNFTGFICSECENIDGYLGRTEDLAELIDKHNIHVVFHTISFFNGGNDERQGKTVLGICNKKGVRLHFVPRNQRWFRNLRSNVESIGDMVMLNPQEIPLDNVAYRFQKRLFDIIFSSLVIVFILSWLFPIIAILIKLSSRGPVIFKQQRTGINNKTFACYKFRSMKQNKDSDTKQATANDNRITRIGKFLRKTNIDEFPQFFNVLKGNMSVVGPRPHMLLHTEEYSALIDHYLIRHYVKPGITGWAQVKGYRGETSTLSAMEKRVNADMEYIENWTFVWDIKIIWLTLFGRHAWKNAH